MHNFDSNTVKRNIQSLPIQITFQVSYEIVNLGNLILSSYTLVFTMDKAGNYQSANTSDIPEIPSVLPTHAQLSSSC